MQDNPVSRCQKAHGWNTLQASWCHTVNKPEVRVHGMETTVSWVHALSGKLGPRMKPGPPDSGWNPAIFLVLFTASEDNKGIYTDDAAG